MSDSADKLDDLRRAVDAVASELRESRDRQEYLLENLVNAVQHGNEIAAHHSRLVQIEMYLETQLGFKSNKRGSVCSRIEDVEDLYERIGKVIAGGDAELGLKTKNEIVWRTWWYLVAGLATVCGSIVTFLAQKYLL